MKQIWQRPFIYLDERNRFGKKRSSFRVVASLFAIALTLTLSTSSLSQSQIAQVTADFSPTSAQPIAVKIGRQKIEPLTLVKGKGKLEERLELLGISLFNHDRFAAPESINH